VNNELNVYLGNISLMYITASKSQNAIRMLGHRATLLMCCFGCASCNSMLFYKPQRYDPQTVSLIRSTPRIAEIEYETSDGHQVSFYLSPEIEPNKPPDRLWMLFGGIDALAFGWYEYFKEIPDKRCGLFFFEYPGYGLCEGKPREEKILNASLAAFDALAVHLGCPIEAIEQNLGLLGHSLGTATMMQFAASVQARRLVLISPMTSISDQIREMYGAFDGALLSLINPERYDNRARLHEIIQRDRPPRITIIHGRKDALIPVRMGRELAAMAGKLATYYEIPDKDHSGFIAAELPLIYNVMFGRARSPNIVPFP
jgi:pimeloyl-ACP methyl ester carboxylesterase